MTHTSCIMATTMGIRWTKWNMIVDSMWILCAYVGHGAAIEVLIKK